MRLQDDGTSVDLRQCRVDAALVGYVRAGCWKAANNAPGRARKTKSVKRILVILKSVCFNPKDVVNKRATI
jgi:hypothetical protein